MLDSDWIHFGWQGIEFGMPGDWSLSRIEGDRANGYARLDDEKMVRLELKWGTDKNGKYKFDREIEKQIKELRKKGKKARVDLDIRRNVKIAELEGRSWECFFWKGDATSYSMLTHCDTCGRVILMRVLFEHQEPSREVCKKIFESVSDHRDDCKDFWNVFNLKIRLPSSFELTQSGLKTGEIRLLFANGREQVEAIRVGLAEMQLRETDLDEWFRHFYSKELAAYDFEVNAGKCKGHRGLKVIGRTRLRSRLLPPFRNLQLQCRSWHCQPEDKLYILRSTLRKENSAVFTELFSSLSCH